MTNSTRYVRIDSPTQPDALIVRDLDTDVIYCFDESESIDDVAATLDAWGAFAPIMFDGHYLGSTDANGQTGYAFFGLEPSDRLEAVAEEVAA